MGLGKADIGSRGPGESGCGGGVVLPSVKDGKVAEWFPEEESRDGNRGEAGTLNAPTRGRISL
tara:strand:+ start:657 stop:845 length:189 start_codon:yes stop_codon:yes gene_type:complete